MYNFPQGRFLRLAHAMYDAGRMRMDQRFLKVRDQKKTTQNQKQAQKKTSHASISIGVDAQRTSHGLVNQRIVEKALKSCKDGKQYKNASTLTQSLCQYHCVWILFLAPLGRKNSTTAICRVTPKVILKIPLNMFIHVESIPFILDVKYITWNMFQRKNMQPPKCSINSYMFIWNIMYQICIHIYGSVLGGAPPPMVPPPVVWVGVVVLVVDVLVVMIIVVLRSSNIGGSSRRSTSRSRCTSSSNSTSSTGTT